MFDVGLAPCLPDPAAEVVEHKIDVPIISGWHDRGRAVGHTHCATPNHRDRRNQETGGPCRTPRAHLGLLSECDRCPTQKRMGGCGAYDVMENLMQPG